MAIFLEQGVFENIGDNYTLELLPINSVVSFNSFNDLLNGVLVDRYFTKEFRYSLDGKVTFTPYVPLTNLNLQALVPNILDVFIFQFRYTRAGANVSGTLNWVQFELDSVTVQACIVMKINKNNYDALYGVSKFNEINAAIIDFNSYAIPKFSKGVFLVIDPAVDDLSIDFEFDDACVDFNELIKTEFGKSLIDTFFKERIDLFDGIRS